MLVVTLTFLQVLEFALLFQCYCNWVKIGWYHFDKIIKHQLLRLYSMYREEVNAPYQDSPHCICGMLGDADHYICSCSLTKEFHLIKPADEHKKVWFNNLLTNRQALTKMEGTFRTSRNICDTLTQERDHN
ncbi:hypothetical protein AVEN_105115-1 [Araneus ventricosus]|uniref:Uncharacterized protein n=2 Tax=Araneus ventricosus TaxID=182803 RepID=A0A4Y2RB49_ARAVE|nr:hypothetical protein AVEN_105115-1 [Araneus ventricosus]